jgi:hypothetical protein
MSQAVRFTMFFGLLFAAAIASSQRAYQAAPVSDPGKITGTVKWSGPIPPSLKLAINKDPEVCDPESRKTRDLERLIVGPQGGVANAVVFLKNVSRGKAMEVPRTQTLPGPEALSLRAPHSVSPSGGRAAHEEL